MYRQETISEHSESQSRLLVDSKHGAASVGVDEMES
jgi:hypothetical protein